MICAGSGVGAEADAATGSAFAAVAGALAAVVGSFAVSAGSFESDDFCDVEEPEPLANDGCGWHVR